MFFSYKENDNLDKFDS